MHHFLSSTFSFVFIQPFSSLPRKGKRDVRHQRTPVPLSPSAAQSDKYDRKDDDAQNTTLLYHRINPHTLQCIVCLIRVLFPTQSTISALLHEQCHLHRAATARLSRHTRFCRFNPIKKRRLESTSSASRIPSLEAAAWGASSAESWFVPPMISTIRPWQASAVR